MKLGTFSGARTFFVSDPHFGHQNIIKYCDRPWQWAREMDEALIVNWNVVVPEGSDVFVLGDVSFLGTNNTEMIMNRLQGVKHLIVGNHDRVDKMGKHFKSVCDIGEIIVDGTKIVMCHFPLESWRADLHLHGHTHGKSRARFNRLDVGVDANAADGFGYRPQSWEDVQERRARVNQQCKTLGGDNAL